MSVDKKDICNFEEGLMRLCLPGWQGPRLPPWYRDGEDVSLGFWIECPLTESERARILLREVFGGSRPRMATHLALSPSNVDRLLRGALTPAEDWEYPSDRHNPGNRFQEAWGWFQTLEMLANPEIVTPERAERCLGVPRDSHDELFRWAEQMLSRPDLWLSSDGRWLVDVGMGLAVLAKDYGWLPYGPAP